MDEIDFYQEGLIAAELVEDGKVDASYEHIRVTLSDLVSDSYRSQTTPEVAEKARKFLAELDSDEERGGIMMPKMRGIELMLFDRNVTSEQKKELLSRYRDRSVRYLTLARQHPYQSAAMEFLDDLVHKDVKGTGVMLARGVKDIGVEIGTFLYHTADALIGGAILGGLFLPTGMRRLFSVGAPDDYTDGKEAKLMVKFFSGCVGLIVSGVFVVGAYYTGDQGLDAQIIKYGIPAAWMASALYEAGRFATKRITANKERLASYRALPQDAIFTAPVPEEQQVRIVLEPEDDVPIYVDVDGQEELVELEAKKPLLLSRDRIKVPQ